MTVTDMAFFSNVIKMIVRDDRYTTHDTVKAVDR